MTSTTNTTRRQFIGQTLGAAAAGALPFAVSAANAKSGFKLNYILASAMYGYTDVADVVAEVKKTGADAIDIWPKVHGDQREQIEKIGHERFAELLKQHGVKLGTDTCYKLGPFGMQQEMEFAAKLGGRGVVMVTGAKGPRDVRGKELKAAVAKFLEQLKPHVAQAEKTGCVIAVENHGRSLIETPDSIRWFGEMNESDHLGIAFAPHHLTQYPEPMRKLIEELGPNVKFFYAQEHGMGSSKKLPKAQEMLQMPARGPLDFEPLIAGLKKINYTGYSEIFMHPVPRGVPILDTTAAITEEINHSRAYLDGIVKKLAG
ncbi:MAG: xylose isomerase [Planctomycetaceae bacterium]|nr:xylose isomerase [Planctomycetaceae bacterium]